MESLGDMLAKRSIPKEPVEVALLREFVQKKYNITPHLSVGDYYITMAVPNAALASTLRFDETEIKTACKLTKKLRIRIGQ